MSFADKKILAGHDISDGGLITCILEMSFAGIAGIDVDVKHKFGSPVEVLFAEEVGWVLEVNTPDLDHVLNVFKKYEAPVAHYIGSTTSFGMKSKV